MTATVTYTIDTTAAHRMMQQMELRLGPGGMNTFLRSVGVHWFQERAADRFDSEGDDASGKWQELSENTKNIRTAHGFSRDEINFRTGEMRAWVETAGGNVTSVGGVSVLEWPGDVPTGELAKKITTAQMGKPKPSTPPRPVIAMGEVDLLAMMQLMDEFIMGARGLL